ncbi:pyrroloquinoline quinone biosynthesis protein PqqB [Rubellimicrobium arenae]|uniref:pyrroloquinoline quinone biosynthesis protein PqqB n=1 Tax=Rubellimicrobium arenae TaxID=2817372 RepID=UPI001B306F87|nr:pyrroloquinoline quinone biosynthesis protein PqqB [Rubellimicrobium arenae]
MPKIIVLGVAAGGGVPQWNCNCGICRAARHDPGLQSGQASLAVSADGRHWFLVNASPDLRAQVTATPALHPDPAHLRHTPIAGVVLTNAEVDAVAGLLSMREGSSFGIWGPPKVLGTLAANPIFGVLPPDRVPRRALSPGEAVDLPLPDGTPSGLTVEAFDVPGKVAWYLEGAAPEGGDTVGLTFRARGRTAHVVTACARVTPDLAERLRGADTVFFDGTLWTDDEMIRAGLGAKTGQRMGHISISGADGSIAALEPLGIRQKIFIHVNNSNPVLRPDSPERMAAEAAGWIVPQAGSTFS